MRIQRHRDAIEILAPAKLNLFLEVLGKRQDGFHEIDTIMCPVDLCDRLIVEPTASDDITLELKLPQHARLELPAWSIPVDANNLVIRALDKLRRVLGTSAGCRVTLEKQVPAAAGLAGGSSDAAAAVCAGMMLWSRWNRPLATSVCEELGSDIPFFLGDPSRCGLARATGRGERLELLSSQPKLDFALSCPPVGCSTAEVYRQLQIPKAPRSSSLMTKACADGNVEKIGIELFNALQFSAAGLTNWIDRQLKTFRLVGLEHCMMTGSGSCCFALLTDPGFGSLDALATAGTLVEGLHIARAQSFFGPSIESQV